MNHLKCSFCGCIFDAELKRCPDCGTKVKRKEANQYYTGPLDLKVAAVANSYPEKDILCSILDAEEIPYLLDFPDGGMASSSLLGEQAAVIHIMVREAELEKAQALLAEAQDQAEEIDWDTIDVGEPLDEDYE
ncbi:MAG: hypothetical protein IKM60_03535 [Clostridia bacterium]|nr:hypothetical protein [Clostridia bacterium]